MSHIHFDLNDHALLVKTEKNFVEEMAGHGRAAPFGELHTDSELTWFITDVDGPNGVLWSTFTERDHSYIQDRISQVLEHFKVRSIYDFVWRLGPHSIPSNLASLLREHGFKPIKTLNNLILHSSELRNTQTAAASLAIREVTTREELQLKCRIEQQGFDASDEDMQRYYHNYVQSGFGPTAPWRHYIAYQHERPVAVASLLLHADIAGIYGLTTLPEARRQGIGTQLTQHLIAEGQKMGHDLFILSDSEMSAHLYRHLGFREYYQVELYAVSMNEQK